MTRTDRIRLIRKKAVGFVQWCEDYKFLGQDKYRSDTQVSCIVASYAKKVMGEINRLN